MDKIAFAENLFMLDEMFLEVDCAVANLNRCGSCKEGSPVSGPCNDCADARQELGRVLKNFRPPEELDLILGQLGRALEADKTGELEEVLSAFQRSMTLH